MLIIAKVTLAFALVVLLILGFLRVARELLLRSSSEAPPPRNGAGFQRH